MTSDKLLRIAYNYYPRNIDCITKKESYIKTKEYELLTNKIKENKAPYSKDMTKLIKELKSASGKEFIFNDTTYFEWLDRCYTFEYIKEIKNKNEFYLLKLYKSILIPYFFIRCFNVKVIDGESHYINILKKDFLHQNLIHRLSTLSEKHELIEFDFDLISKKIIDINFDDIQMGNFTFFNAFFLTQNIIT